MGCHRGATPTTRKAGSTERGSIVQLLLLNTLHHLSLNKEMANNLVSLKLIERVLSAAYETFIAV